MVHHKILCLSDFRFLLKKRVEADDDINQDYLHKADAFATSFGAATGFHSAYPGLPGSGVSRPSQHIYTYAIPDDQNKNDIPCELDAGYVSEYLRNILQGYMSGIGINHMLSLRLLRGRVRYVKFGVSYI